MSGGVIEIPAEDRQVAAAPPLESWEALADANAEAAGTWEFRVAGVTAAGLREAARREALGAASEYSARLAIPHRAPGGVPDRVVMTGHQPTLFHPGVWAKMFAVDRLARALGGVGVDCIVDSDLTGAVGLRVPCVGRGTGTCFAELANGSEEEHFGATAVPGPAGMASFADEAMGLVGELGNETLSERFGGFCTDLRSAAGRARSVSDLVTAARRRYESAAGTEYLELPVSEEARSRAFLTFAADIALDAARFRSIHNDRLDVFRRDRGIRSSARPFPSLGRQDGAVELPFWSLAGGRRRALWVRDEGGIELFTRDGTVCALPADPDGAAEALVEAGPSLAPRAVTLTMYNRLFVADLFVHGSGGSAYDAVTDDIVREYYGVEPPGYAAVTLTLRLPLERGESPEAELAEARLRQQAIEHNPDRIIRELGRAVEGVADEAMELVGEKEALVEAISRPDADRKLLGERIRDANARLGAFLGPLAEETAARIEELEARRDGLRVLAGRDYPFCLFDAREVRDLLA